MCGSTRVGDYRTQLDHPFGVHPDCIGERARERCTGWTQRVGTGLCGRQGRPHCVEYGRLPSVGVTERANGSGISEHEGMTHASSVRFHIGG